MHFLESHEEGKVMVFSLADKPEEGFFMRVETRESLLQQRNAGIEKAAVVDTSIRLVTGFLSAFLIAQKPLFSKHVQIDEVIIEALGRGGLIRTVPIARDAKRKDLPNPASAA